ncbi:uncharacterized protein LOC133199452 [Saccostrea echinata]|uniref:uncharacterized protein LOC133199395 n=1 Tax=Saccostrea echinata TaxID=191078 RepID=UPI002A83E201|nr:uncharacterized protein LOC133199395 [Saccostrea echinata]XP_061191237.1 uncharacterized protein LOC133199452 [Saccostrea echinata]
MDSRIIIFCFLTFLAGEIAASSHEVCPATVPSTGGGGALLSCSDDSQCTVLGEKCCNVTTGSGKVCIKAGSPNHHDDDDCDKKSDGKSKDDCRKGKHHKKVIIIIVSVVAVVVVGFVVGCVIKVKYCKKKISDSQTDLNIEKSEVKLGKDYTPTKVTSGGGKQSEQAWLSVTPAYYISSPPPVYTKT